MASAVEAASSRPPSLSPAWRMTGWPWGLRGTLKRPCDVELRAPVGEVPGRAVAEEPPGRLVGHDLVLRPRVPQLPGGAHELAGPLVAVGVVEVAAPPEVLAGEGVGGGHHVPAGPALREVVERGELAGQLVGLAERGVERAHQAEVRR